MRTEERLVQEIKELEVSRDQAKAAVDNVLELLRKADLRRREEGDRPWNRILDNLERALDLTRARFTTYEQLLKERRRDLDFLRQSGRTGAADPSANSPSIEEQVLIDTLREVLPEDVPLPRNHILAAERILAMSLDVLGNLPLEEVASRNAQLFEDPEAETQKQSQDASATVPKEGWLDARIARAKQTREALAAARRPESTFGERRRQVILRNAIEKVIVGNFNLLDLSEIDLVLQCAKIIGEKPSRDATDARLKSVIERSTAKLNERASELRRRRAQMYARKPYPNNS
jgi:hypothetical protein